MSLNNFIIDRLGDVIRMGGELVSDEEYERRLAICKVCPHFGTVKPLPLLSAEGCTLCGCPTRTKAKTAQHFSASEGKVIETICPDPDGNKWAQNIISCL